MYPNALRILNSSRLGTVRFTWNIAHFYEKIIFLISDAEYNKLISACPPSHAKM